MRPEKAGGCCSASRAWVTRWGCTRSGWFWVKSWGVTLAWVIVARRFKAYSDRYEAITVPDFLERRFGDDRLQLLRKLSIVIILSMVTAYCCAQLVASGKAFSSFLGVTYTTGVLIGAVVTMFYTTVGGFKAVAYSDLVQGVLMALGLLILPFVGFAAAGGWGEVMSTLNAIDPSLLLPMGEYGVSWRGVVSAASFGFIGVAFLGVPQLLTRFMSAKSEEEIVEGSLIAVICILIFDFGAVFAGIAGRALFPVLDDPETVMPMMADQLFPAVFTGIFLVIVLGGDHVDRRLASDLGVVSGRTRPVSEDPSAGCRRRNAGTVGQAYDRSGGPFGVAVRDGRGQSLVLVRSVRLVGACGGLHAGGPTRALLAEDDPCRCLLGHAERLSDHGVLGSVLQGQDLGLLRDDPGLLRWYGGGDRSQPTDFASGGGQPGNGRGRRSLGLAASQVGF